MTTRASDCNAGAAMGKVVNIAQKKMLDDLERSGLDARDAKHMELEVKTAAQTKALVGVSRVSYVIPYKDTDFFRVRFLGKGFAGKGDRYRQPKNTPPHLYKTPGQPWDQYADDTDKELVVTEGEKKSYKACKEGIVTLGLGGIDSFAAKKHGYTLIPDYDTFAQEDRKIIIVPDAPDFKVNPDVRRAVFAQTVQLLLRGVAVFVVELPANGDKKCGLDDYLVEQGAAEFKKLKRVPITRLDCIKNMKFPESDAGNAELFAFLHGGETCYIHQMKQWAIYNNDHWERDEKSGILLKAKGAVRLRQQAATQIADGDTRKRALAFTIKSESTYALNAMLDQAKAEPSIATSVTEWDADPWLLGVANGVVDLRTGELVNDSRTCLISKRCTVPYDPNAKCPRWEQALREILVTEKGKVDVDMVTYMRRALGYSITGNVQEENVVLGDGGGRNGKDTICETVSYILGDYSLSLPFDVLAVKSGRGAHNQLTPELAALHGVRFLFVSEIEEGQTLSAALLKKLSGGNTLTVNPKYVKPFSFEPTHKLWIFSNHRPRITDTTDSIWARLHRVPFRVGFGTADEVPYAQFRKKKDPRLKEILRNESQGILAWLVRGALEWQKHGLQPPISVNTATTEYRRDEDVLGNWLEEHCVVGNGYKTPGKELYANYFGSFDSVSSRYALGASRFYKLLEHKFRCTKPKNVHTFHGVRLRSERYKHGKKE